MNETTAKYEWISEPLQYKTHTLYWLSCTETQAKYSKAKKGSSRQLKQQKETKFVWLTSLVPDSKTVHSLAQGGRNRW